MLQGKFVIHRIFLNGINKTHFSFQYIVVDINLNIVKSYNYKGVKYTGCKKLKFFKMHVTSLLFMFGYLTLY